MASIPLEWRTNFRTNLILWPEVAPNVAAMAKCDGLPYEEAELIKRFPEGTEEKGPKDGRAVRQTFEAFAVTGLAFKDSQKPQHFRLTPLGSAVFSFLGVTGGARLANEMNRAVLADVMLRGLSLVVEYRAVWMLMRKVADILTNEELNRAMNRIRFLEDVDAAAEAVLMARVKNDPTLIGPRIYDDDKYSDDQKRGDQRKVMNPIFLLAGGGGVFISLESTKTEYRRIEDWAIPLIDRRLEDPSPQINGLNQTERGQLLSEFACVPRDVWTP